MKKNQDSEVRELHAKWISAWNQQDAAGMAAVLTKDANVIGFDGSQMNGPDEVKKSLSEIFAHHPTGLYVFLIREVRFISTDVALLRADVGMHPRTSLKITPSVNAIQSMIACRTGDSWKVSLFHNTPAAFHSQPELAHRLTTELQNELDRQQNAKN